MNTKTEEDKRTFEKDGIVHINTGRWVRPITACKIFRKNGVKVSRANMNYWINSDKIKSMKIKSLGNLTLVDLESAPEEVQRYIK